MVQIVVSFNYKMRALKIIPGLWVFGPAFKEQQEEKNKQARYVLGNLVVESLLISNRKALDDAKLSESAEKEALRKAEAESSRSAATESTQQSTSSSSLWNMGLWSKGSDANTTKPAERNTKS